MLYMYKDKDNAIVTDSVINYIPKTLGILFDGKIFGNYSNTSTDKNYLKFTISSGDTETLNYGEHKMSITQYEKVLKEELVLVDSLVNPQIIEKSKEKIIINYEKK